ncbi:MAG: DUF4159 domain-containing protein [Candidatus Marinimicrobia bacterium]|jgi:hypothetical protein|nr:DUF4159 domain-containing protein [Candidatus Neomarinimicrobiota bacterium]MBT3948275.1 DUF4159 domain-containing protein [Candidatus Neomarinimicrobiota bacterium]MBT4065428.1 DUF4159 domain-containing protein [Candidatus Neomarinimicrobiota bacterium]MBT4307294.1 DUF4159 domain-containing protein [Candidatus Neomarinimicrobiota bacterium]MBT4454221.1 DUF4159 domain-containing protein [Candidatus Neomarinimicrobiota bacterium]|tara:strand:- start:1709 stop:2368 length:660 start_codon:yes stop_codon:yes gene_type:complete
MVHLKFIRHIILLASIIVWLPAQAFSIARIHYGGGGDWYGDPSSLPNLLNYISEQTSIVVDPNEYRIKLTDPELFSHSFLYLTGHGNIRFTEDEMDILRNYLLKGGFLHADDNYGMDTSFRREMKRVFPEKDWVMLPFDHDIFHSFYDFPQGLPKIHEHDGNPPQGLGLFEGDRLIVFYSYESDLGDGWEDAEVHNDPKDIRHAALKMGINIVWYSLTQ